MLRFENTHIFTGYLKQLLSSVNIPTCKIYTREFSNYLQKTGKEDPRIIRSFDTLSKNRLAFTACYLVGDQVYSYFDKTMQITIENEKATSKPVWRHATSVYYNPGKSIPNFTKTLDSPGIIYNSTTHEYLGDYLRFLRDYYDINLMSLYNCFSRTIYNNIYYKLKLQSTIPYSADSTTTSSAAVRYAEFDSQDPNYIIYAFPVKLFENYTIAIDSEYGLEMFCGLYKSVLDTTERGVDLIKRTYKKINQASFNKPFLYDKLDVKHWKHELIETDALQPYKANLLNPQKVTRYDIAAREQDLKLFIKVPVRCKSSITILEGDFRGYNDAIYYPELINKTPDDPTVVWHYLQNNTAVTSIQKDDVPFKPISKLQLLAINTGESYPFADRLIEYMCGSAITPNDPVPDNIKRVQAVMNQNNHHFKIQGLWEEKMQKIIYDYIMHAGPFQSEAVGDTTYKLVDRRRGQLTTQGCRSKSMLYDILGYVDKDAEKIYASWKISKGKATMQNNIHSANIYGDLYDLD